MISLDNENERNFYEIEAAENNWNLPELRRQFDSGLYERLALSRDKASIKALSKVGQVISGPRDIIKAPYVLEFLGIDEKAQFSETYFERAIIDKIEHFLLELGKGFLFEARQKRFTFNEEHFFVDLVFYNRLLRSYVLIDLKIGKLTHQNLGQMQMYVNYFDRFVKRDDENSTIGIILCRKKNEALVEITLPKDAKMLVPKRIRPYDEPFVGTPKNPHTGSGGHHAAQGKQFFSLFCFGLVPIGLDKLLALHYY